MFILLVTFPVPWSKRALNVGPNSAELSQVVFPEQVTKRRAQIGPVVSVEFPVRVGMHAELVRQDRRYRMPSEEAALPDLKLFVAPMTCARVPTIALEEIGVPFETELIRTAAGQQTSPEFLKVNPKGKVPALLIDGEPLTENVAILSWLNRTYPEAGLLPPVSGDLDTYRQIADLAFFSATVHPLVTRIAMPIKFIADAAESFETVRPAGVEAMKPVMAMIDARLAEGPWWYGDRWSVVDGYLFWVWWRITGVGFPGDEFPNIVDHAARMSERPSVVRAMAREAANVEILQAEGNYRPPR